MGLVQATGGLLKPQKFFWYMLGWIWKKGKTRLKTQYVGTLPKGYIRNLPLPQVLPRVQSAKSREQVHTIPDYYKTTYAVPMYISPRSRVESAAYASSLAWHAIAINN